MSITQKPKWIVNVSEALFKNIKIIKIYKFYLNDTPIDALSWQSISLEKYGWKQPWSKNENLKNKLKNVAHNKDLLFSSAKLSDIDKALLKAGMDKSTFYLKEEEVACFFNNQHNQFISVFYHIRNALAHGRYIICYEKKHKDYKIVFEDINVKQNNKTSARIILYLETMLKWIKIIKKGP